MNNMYSFTVVTAVFNSLCVSFARPIRRQQLAWGGGIRRNLTKTDIRSALKIPTIRQTIRKLAVNFFSNIDGHENPSIQAISTYPTYPFIRRPRDILVDPDFN
ncbi:hypothetical protein TNCV_2209571 [Trichonephila clavipes]|nr:hypothetical protein TNCV_2209571 [Trichonephila clavipes]